MLFMVVLLSTPEFMLMKRLRTEAGLDRKTNFVIREGWGFELGAISPTSREWRELEVKFSYAVDDDSGNHPT